MLHLYHSPYSTCSQKVRLALFEKGLPFEKTELHFWKGEHLSPKYLEINPNGVVPSLVHDGAPVIDSSVIVEYLDEVYPEHSLSPDTPLERARMRAWLRYLEEVPTVAIRVPSFNRVFVGLREDLTPDQLEQEAEKRPLRKKFYQDMGRKGFGKDRYDASLDQLKQTIARMEAALEAQDWLCGDKMTLADICVIPTIDRMQDLGLSDLWDDAPNVSRWWAAVQARDSFQQTYYPGTRVSERYEIAHDPQSEESNDAH